MKKRRGGTMGTVMALITGLAFFGLFLAVLTQFGGDLGALFQWIINTAWSFVITIRDSIGSWDTFQRLF